MSEYPLLYVNSIYKTSSLTASSSVCSYYQLCFEGQFCSYRIEDETSRKKKVAAFSAAATCLSHYANVSVLIKFHERQDCSCVVT